MATVVSQALVVLSVVSKVLLLWVAASVATVEVLPALDMVLLVLHMSVVDVVVSPATVALSALGTAFRMVTEVPLVETVAMAATLMVMNLTSARRTMKLALSQVLETNMAIGPLISTRTGSTTKTIQVTSQISNKMM